MRYGMCGQSVHERLQRLGAIVPTNVWTDAELKWLKKEYSQFADAGRLDDLAKRIGRPKTSLCKQARELGLTNQHRPCFATRRENQYNGQHARVRVIYGSPKKCEICGETNPRKWYEWANMTGDYDNPNDYKRMCRKCHRRYDRERVDSNPALIIAKYVTQECPVCKSIFKVSEGIVRRSNGKEGRFCSRKCANRRTTD